MTTIRASAAGEKRPFPLQPHPEPWRNPTPFTEELTAPLGREGLAGCEHREDRP